MKKTRRWTIAQIMIPGFAALILLGGLVLMLPVCNKNGAWLNFTDALFTACTCVCVTGLTTVTPAVQFTVFGKLVLLFLIQIGGLGILVCTMYFMVLLGRRVSINARVLLKNRFSTDSLGGMVRLLRYVVEGTLLVEVLGSIGYAVRFIPRYGIGKGICFSIFHAVSAFCNAGVDLLGGNSLSNYANDLWMLLVTTLLIVSGGLGFLVWKDLGLLGRRIFREHVRPGTAVRRMRLHTKLTLIMTGVLLLGGTLFFALAEWANPETLGKMGIGGKWMSAFFQSVTTRTAGFYSIPQAALTEGSKFFACILMFIGGSPVGTAGGIKTVTLAVVALTCWSILKGHPDTECFHRKVAAETVRTAVLVMCVGLLLVLGGTVALSLLEPELALIDALFEVASSVATVGLTADVTPGLGTAAKWLIIFLMYMGRIGPVTIPLVIASKLGKNGNWALPEEHVVVG